jgi:hypothetical protein
VARRIQDRRADARKGVTIYGLDGTKRLLRLHAPDLKKEMDKVIRQDILGPVVRSARDNISNDAPLSGWDYSPRRPGSSPSYSPYGRRWDYERLAWNPQEMRRQIRVRQGGRAVRGKVERSAWSVRSDHPAAAVWELMGLGKSNVPMVRTARRLTPSRTGRILYKAWDNNAVRQTAPHQIQAVIREYEAKLQERLRNVGDR